MFVLALIFLVWAWRGAMKTLPRAFIPLIAVVAAALLVVQYVEFPVAGGGSTWHFMGGTIVSLVLGPFGTIVSMTITLIIQALAFGDGGVTSFGANVVNMAVIGGLSFYIIKAVAGSKFSGKRLALSVFAAAFLSNVATALAVGVQIGVYPLAGELGGMALSVPTMLVWYVPTGLLEGVVAAALIVPLSRIKAVRLHGLEMLKIKQTESG
jgi:cobalt/nickel transport system permease protein